MSQSKLAVSKNYTITKKEITPCGYIGYEIDSGITQLNITTALMTAVSLMQKEIVHSVGILGENEMIQFTFKKDHTSHTGNGMIYQDNTQIPFMRFVDYGSIRFIITTYRMPEKHRNIIENKITDFVEMLDYISYFLLTPLSKPFPTALNGELTLRDRLNLINYKEMDFKINFDSSDDGYEDLLEDYFELEAKLVRKKIMRLAQDVCNDSTRIKAMVYLNEEETEFTLVTSTKKEDVVEWDWDYEHEKIRFHSSPFDINKDYFRAVIRLNKDDLKIIQTLNGITEVLQYLKK